MITSEIEESIERAKELTRAILRNDLLPLDATKEERRAAYATENARAAELTMIGLTLLGVLLLDIHRIAQALFIEDLSEKLP